MENRSNSFEISFRMLTKGAKKEDYKFSVRHPKRLYIVPGFSKVIILNCNSCNSGRNYVIKLQIHHKNGNHIEECNMLKSEYILTK